MGWNLNDSTTSLLPNISFLSRAKFFRTPPKCDELLEYTDSAHTEVEDLSSRYMNGSVVVVVVAEEVVAAVVIEVVVILVVVSNCSNSSVSKPLCFNLTNIFDINIAINKNVLSA